MKNYIEDNCSNEYEYLGLDEQRQDALIVVDLHLLKNCKEGQCNKEWDWSLLYIWNMSNQFATMIF
jgi:hypothetical protein